ncbi:MAG: bifunctional 5,10-methylenetetrahydrofolate dehydrogenase/5,10-methenyltetrahydrofolate cyclohydrolase [Oscillospiraceae bacterium]|nr:bifunctional 5,10-methylenetetrahydrofolate dehydrogenase/5,10-methenyltetrahydrofolate cyclohydrolase [Oscillospiraceae bacterium]
MAKQLLGKEVNAALNARIIADCEAVKAKGVNPTLAIVRCGERPDDLSYERGATKRAEALGVAVEKFVLPEDVSKEELLKVIDDINANDRIHGVLLFRPLPYGIDCTGKKAVVIGRSLVVGKPLGIMLMGKNATVTTCHTRTKDVPAVTKEADILVSAAGVLKSLTKEYVRPGQIVIDVSINWDEAKGGIAGDAVYEEVEPIVEAITPVPGGVGAVTTSVLIGHVVEAAKRTLG